MKVLSIRLNGREAAQLDALCERTGLTPSKAVKRGLDELVAKQSGKKTLGQLARELNLVGCFSGPPVLAERHGHYLRQALRKPHAKSAG